MTEQTNESSRVLQGTVASNKMEKTVTVLVERRVKHPLYGKYVVKSKKYHVHDDLGCGEGDTVEIAESRPYSKTVSWKVTKIVKKAVVI
ncbi:MAG: 30S ribosomal protein S17 [Burkholderia sp.]|jgi:small subunit ribosomal protein S17